MLGKIKMMGPYRSPLIFSFCFSTLPYKRKFQFIFHFLSNLHLLTFPPNQTHSKSTSFAELSTFIFLVLFSEIHQGCGEPFIIYLLNLLLNVIKFMFIIFLDYVICNIYIYYVSCACNLVLMSFNLC